MEAGESPHLPVREEWLARTSEPALEPEIPVIDAHHHLWDRPGSRYVEEDLRRDIASGHDIRATVYVQCRSFYRSGGEEALRPVGEVERIAGIAAERASPERARIGAAIVGGADLGLGDRVEPVLEAMIVAAGGRLRGIRNPTAWHADPSVRSSPVLPPAGLLCDRRFREGVARLAPLGLVLDVWIYQTQLPELRDLASVFPGTTIVLDHLGGPLCAGRDAALSAEWRREMRALARLPNVRVKLGGLGMRVTGYLFHERAAPPSSRELADAWKPWIATCIELFGPGRCMFESNFPVDKGMFGYPLLWNAFKRLTAGFATGERAALFSGTAGRVYGIRI